MIKLICPNCKGRLTVLDTRPNYQDKSEVYRKMVCKQCGEWYYSEERLRSLSDKEFAKKWEKSDRWSVRKKKDIQKFIKNASDAAED